MYERIAVEVVGDVVKVHLLDRTLEQIGTDVMPPVWVEFGKLADQGHRYLLLDLSGVTYVSEEGIAMLIRLQQRMKSANGAIALHAVNPTVRGKCVIAGADELLRIAPTEAGALDLLRV